MDLNLWQPDSYGTDHIKPNSPSIPQDSGDTWRDHPSYLVIIVGQWSTAQASRNLVLGKRHVALSYHRVREAVAAGMMRFEWIPGPDNPPADILSKHWGYQQASEKLHALLFKPPDNYAEDAEADEQRGGPQMT